jgi:hypothetical protein
MRTYRHISTVEYAHTGARGCVYSPVISSPSDETNRMNKIAGVNEQFGSLLAAAPVAKLR